MQTIQPRLTIRSPSLESFDWFKEYIDYSKSINGSPTTSENPLMEMLLRFQKVLDDYENERAYKSIAEGLHPEHPCHYYRILNTISALPYGLGDAGEKVTPMTIENWAQASVKEAIQFNGRNSLFMAMVGEAVGEVYIALGRLWEAKIYLEQTILEMKRLDTPLYARKEVTLSLARCYSELGNIQQADDLLKVLFKTEYPKIVASSYFYLEKYCQECRVRLLKRCYSKAKDDLVKYVNATVGYEWEEDDEFPAYDWEEDDMELGIRVAAAELIRKFNPGIMERMRGCDDNGFECSGAANDELDDELDEDMQWDGQ
jgi:tetratricopeptide (TPR) repeat protein